MTTESQKRNVPEVEVDPKAQRRQFSAKYKLDVLKRAAAVHIVVGKLVHVVRGTAFDKSRTEHALHPARGIHHDGRRGVRADVLGDEAIQQRRLRKVGGPKPVLHALANTMFYSDFKCRQF
jgi:hypothetical protein